MNNVTPATPGSDPAPAPVAAPVAAPVVEPAATRPRLDRFLIAIVIGLVALLIVAGLAVVLRPPPVELPANSPGGTVQRFYNAILQKDFNAAYGFLSDSMTDKPTRDRFVQHNLTQSSYNDGQQNDRVRIEEEAISDGLAVVTVNTTHFYSNSSPLGGSNQWTETATFTLRNENDTWRITEMPYNYMPY